MDKGPHLMLGDRTHRPRPAMMMMGGRPPHGGGRVRCWDRRAEGCGALSGCFIHALGGFFQLGCDVIQGEVRCQRGSAAGAAHPDGRRGGGAGAAAGAASTAARTSTAAAHVLGAVTASGWGLLTDFGVPCQAKARGSAARLTDGAELLLDGAEVCHQSIQIHCVTLVQSLCEETNVHTQTDPNKSALKCPYYRFLKMTFHAVCNTALSEWKHPAEFEIWKCTVYKVIVSQKKESTLNHWNESFLKWIPSRFMLTSTWSISILPPTCWSFHICLNENANSFFATRCCFWSSKNICFPGNTVHKAALRSQTLLYQTLQERWDENETNRPITAD